jgi:DNA polymerase-3 subunit epsilon
MAISTFGLAFGWVARLRRDPRTPPRDFLRARGKFHARLPDGKLPFQRYVVFDLETTGLSPSRGDAIVSIGAVRVDNAALAEARFSTLVDPGRPIPPASTRYHGITDAMVQGAPGEAEAVAGFAAFAAGAVLVAHNAAFDMTCLAAAEYRGAPPMPNPALCSLVLSQWLDPTETDHTLDGLAARMDEVIAGRHDALGDALATAAIFVRLLARADARGVDDLTELFRRTRMGARVAEGAEMF